ncbi:hypothetical protein NW065_04235 [Mycoplasmopsis cynos]|nr:hypothetical protein [Mycoplasmopsis cynos]UWV81172.1 hypothetical protein NW065_04235 [Mycoplasmopsis cynos]UWV93138.1 hypothetical protein NWE57_00910 [Mycoplasmopsis cynos]
MVVSEILYLLNSFIFAFDELIPVSKPSIIPLFPYIIPPVGKSVLWLSLIFFVMKHLDPWPSK